jgi:hypothetical protein
MIPGGKSELNASNTPTTPCSATPSRFSAGSASNDARDNR